MKGRENSGERGIIYHDPRMGFVIKKPFSLRSTGFSFSNAYEHKCPTPEKKKPGTACQAFYCGEERE
jgi:hypothetical protein